MLQYEDLIEDTKTLIRVSYLNPITQLCLAVTCKEEYLKRPLPHLKYWPAEATSVSLDDLDAFLKLLKKAPLQARCDLGLRLVQAGKKGTLCMYPTFFTDPDRFKCNHVNLFFPLYSAIDAKGWNRIADGEQWNTRGDQWHLEIRAAEDDPGALDCDPRCAACQQHQEFRRRWERMQSEARARELEIWQSLQQQGVLQRTPLWYTPLADRYGRSLTIAVDGFLAGNRAAPRDDNQTKF
jgi:hypothetical protein